MGNVLTATDAKGVTITNTYDKTGRVTQRSYAGEVGYTTPAVSYFYDNLANAKGRLIKVSSSVSTTEYTSFDILGRVTSHKQTTDGQGYSTAYVYDLSGALVEQTYPSGRVVKNVIDNNGDLSMVQSARCSEITGVNASCTDRHGFFNYARNFSYNAAGAVTSMQLGNGRWESTQFNSRLQPTQIALGATNGATDLLKLDYSYGTTNNNGNVLSQTITVPSVGLNTGFVTTQNYTYDSLNRIKDATENITPTGGSPSQSWKQAFIYDRYGNRNFDEANTTTLPKNCGTSPNFIVCATDRKIVNPAVNAANNRLSTSDNYTYDSSGNTSADAQGRTFVYDAENKQISVSDINGTIGQYFYDGDGKRIKKIVPSTGEVTIFVYDAAGKMVAEYSTDQPQAPKVNFLTLDHLRSPRILTDESGAIVSRRDFRPFGEDVIRSGYGHDDVREKFATYERDEETGLDYAQARFYAARFGRFFSIDPENADADKEVPQSWNAYAYARNNPLKYGDPSGEGVEICSGQDCRYYTEKEWITFLEANKKSGDFVFEGNTAYYKGNSKEVAFVIRSSSMLDASQMEFIRETADQSIKKAKVAGVGVAVAVGAGACIGTGTCALAGAVLIAAGKALLKSGVPQKALQTLEKIKKSEGRTPSGYKGGRTFKNDGRSGGKALPKTDSTGRPITYKEYDVNPHTPGVNRGSERIVRGSDGSSYYTNDHYKTFTKIE